MIHGFLMVKLKPSSQKTIHLKRQACHGGDISTPSKNASPSPLSSMAIHVTSFWSEALWFFFLWEKHHQLFFLFWCYSCTFVQVALSFFAKVHIPVHFCACLVHYIFFVQKKRGWSWNTLSQMDASNFGFHFWLQNHSSSAEFPSPLILKPRSTKCNGATKKNPDHYPFYWLVNTDPYNGLS